MQDEPNKHFLYILICPFDGVIKYVGITNNPAQRLKQHCVFTSTINSDRLAWHQSMINKKVEPIMTILATGTKEHICWLEGHIIKTLIKSGVQLYNKEYDWHINEPLKIKIKAEQSEFMRKAYKNRTELSKLLKMNLITNQEYNKLFNK